MERITASSRSRVIVALLVTVALFVAYWAFWFTARDVVASSNDESYVTFENAFPAADSWLVVCLLGAVTGLVRHSSITLLWLLAGGGGGLFLFAMDVLYDLQHGTWWKSGSAGLIELVINILTIVLSIGFLRWGWRRRVALLAGQ